MLYQRLRACHKTKPIASRRKAYSPECVEKGYSRKFAVTSGRRFRLQGCRLLRTLFLSARIEDKFVGFVAKDCCEQWQLATLQVPENFSKERHIP